MKKLPSACHIQARDNPGRQRRDDKDERQRPFWILIAPSPHEFTYGIGLYSRLPLKGSQVRYLLEKDTPSIFTRITLRDGTEFAMWGVHPAPPRPRSDTDQRDAELMLVAKEAAVSDVPSVVAGDLNDVAWSTTTSLFQKISGLAGSTYRSRYVRDLQCSLATPEMAA